MIPHVSVTWTSPNYDSPSPPSVTGHMGGWGGTEDTFSAQMPSLYTC